MDFTALANPLIGLIAIGSTLCAATFGSEILDHQKRMQDVTAVYGRVIESELINDYMDKKLNALIVDVEKAPDVRTAGGLLRAHKKAYRDELVEKYSVASVKSSLDKAVTGAYQPHYLVRIGEGVGLLMVAVGFGLWLRERYTAPPVSP
ncbi:hypothetical protein QM996_02505 [Sinorhizobium chiapasense]